MTTNREDFNISIWNSTNFIFHFLPNRRMSNIIFNIYNVIYNVRFKSTIIRPNETIFIRITFLAILSFRGNLIPSKF